MPRFLMKSRSRATLLIVLVAGVTLASVFLGLGKIFVALAILSATLLIYIAYLINNKVLEKARREISISALVPGNPRNFDFLVIGEFCSVKDILPEETSNICFLAPGRTLAGSFLILNHVFSLLREGGVVGFVIDRRSLSSKKISIFDVLFFHPVTVKRLGIEVLKKRSRLPLLFSPFLSLRFLVSPKKKVLSEERLVVDEIDVFCRERNISPIFFVF